MLTFGGSPVTKLPQLGVSEEVKQRVRGGSVGSHCTKEDLLLPKNGYTVYGASHGNLRSAWRNISSQSDAVLKATSYEAQNASNRIGIRSDVQCINFGSYSVVII
jgi:hypothetical protein